MLIMRTLQAKRRIAQEQLDALKAKDGEFSSREGELAADLDAMTAETPPETRSILEHDVQIFQEERAAHEAAKTAAEAEIADLDAQIREEAAKPERTAPAPGTGNFQRGSEIYMEGRRSQTTAARRIFGALSPQERAEVFAQEEVRSWLSATRDILRRDPQQRAITNVGLSIPDVMLDVLRAQLEDYSKLLRLVSVRSVRGDARQLITGVPSEAVWTDCCAAINEMTLAFYRDEYDCHKVAGYYTVCNANLEDSDINLASEVLTALAYGIGKALDKAILYGHNAAATMRMPEGIISRLVQTEAPAGYPATARPWVNLASHIVTIPAEATGIDLFKAIVNASGLTLSDYTIGGKSWLMNEKTSTTLQAEGLSINAAGAIVSGMNGTMPVVGGNIETLKFMPDNVIVGGYFQGYTLVERSGSKFAQSEHVRFLQDETVFKGTARYDGHPTIPEGFVVIGIDGTAPTAAMTFPTDTANAA